MKGLIRTKSIANLLSTRAIRVALAIVIFMSMTINSFIPKAIENKEVVATVIGTVVSNIIVETFKECTDTLTVMSNKITKDLYKILRLGEVGTDVPVKSGDNEKETPVNTSSDSGIEITTREYKEILNYEKGIGIVVISEGKKKGDLYRLYNNVKICCSSNREMVVLMFILFIVAIRTRKEEVIKEIVKGTRENKTNLC